MVYATKNGPKRVQGITRIRPKVHLSKEARRLLTAKRRESSARYRKSLGTAWSTIHEAAIQIATDHSKSVRKVQSELHMGHSLLLSKRTKGNAWNAFIWKKSQDVEKENISKSIL
jgi:hypothetical protein